LAWRVVHAAISTTVIENSSNPIAQIQIKIGSADGSPASRGVLDPGRTLRRLEHLRGWGLADAGEQATKGIAEAARPVE
jgi:hypothetical protein